MKSLTSWLALSASSCSRKPDIGESMAVDKDFLDELFVMESATISGNASTTQEIVDDIAQAA